MERDGIIERSTSPWASPLHMVPKKDGSWRPCGDFRRLNLVTEPDVYPLPNMLDFSERLSGCTVFSKIDLLHVRITEIVNYYPGGGLPSWIGLALARNNYSCSPLV
jgi:hypothetical protein